MSRPASSPTPSDPAAAGSGHTIIWDTKTFMPRRATPFVLVVARCPAMVARDPHADVRVRAERLAWRMRDPVAACLNSSPSAKLHPVIIVVVGVVPAETFIPGTYVQQSLGVEHRK